jgi:hypothetical protein
MKSIFIGAIIAAACSGVAMAGELKQDQKTPSPAVKAQVMSDSEMDKVTAGGTLIECIVDAALSGGGGVCTAFATGHGNPPAALPTPTASGVQPGTGRILTVGTTPGHWREKKLASQPGFLFVRCVHDASRRPVA